MYKAQSKNQGYKFKINLVRLLLESVDTVKIKR